MADYIDRSELGIGFCNPAVFNDASYGYGWNAAVQIIQDAPAADVVARDCFDKIIAENDDMRAIIDTYGGLENIQSAFVKLHEIETADVWPAITKPWIEVAEKLPKDRQHIIISTKDGKVGEAVYHAALDYDLDFPAIWFLLNEYDEQYYTESVIAWMPLPTPPNLER